MGNGDDPNNLGVLAIALGLLTVQTARVVCSCKAFVFSTAATVVRGQITMQSRQWQRCRS